MTQRRAGGLAGPRRGEARASVPRQWMAALWAATMWMIASGCGQAPHAPPEDAGMPERDAGPPEADAGPPEADAGPPEADAGPPEADAGPTPVVCEPPASTNESGWVRTQVADNFGIAQAITTDCMGRVYLAGKVTGSNLTFPPGGDHLDATGRPSDAVFLASYEADGSYRWSRVATRGRAVKLARDEEGRVYLLASALAPVPGTTSLYIDQIFLASYEADGSERWRIEVGNIDFLERPADLVVRGGVAYVLGTMRDPMDFGDGVLRRSNDPTREDVDLFVARYATADGAFLDVDIFGADLGGGGLLVGHEDQARAMALDADGNLYVGGLYSPSEAGTSQWGFLLALDPSGALRWSRQYESRLSFWVADLEVGSDGSVFALLGARPASGDTVDVGGGPVTLGRESPLLARYASDGAHLWSSSYGGSYGYTLRSLALDRDDRIYVGGDCAPAVNFGAGRLPGAYRDGCVASFDADGRLLWSWSALSPSDSTHLGASVRTIALGLDGQLYAGGYLGDPRTLFGATVTPGAMEDGLLLAFPRGAASGTSAP